METKALNIHPISEDNCIILYEWRNSEIFRKFCSTRRATVEFKDFIEELKSDFERDRDEQYIAFRKRDKKPVGTIWVYNMNLIDGHCFITTFVDHKYLRLGYGVEMFAALMNYLFVSQPNLNKLYTEAYSYNKHSISIMKKFGFFEEGIFPEHRLLNSQRYSLYRLAFYRKQFNEKKDFFKALIVY